jgi:hypothetical protein
MGIVLAFAPFIAFALVDRLVGATAGLFVAAAVSAVLVLRDWLMQGHSPKILELGSIVLFGGLAIYSVAGKPNWSIMGVRLCVDAGLLLIVLLSIALRRPFTIQYARQQVDPRFWNSPEFLRTNYVISAAWALAFVVLVAADLVLLYVPSIPPRFGIIATIIALIAAIKFTSWYPDRVRAAKAG